MPLSPDAGMLEDSSALDPFDAAEVVEDQPTLHEIPVWLFVRGTLGMTAAAVALTGMHMYLGFRLITPLPLSPGAATTAWATLTLLLLSLPVGVAAARAPRTELAVLVQWVSYLWTAAFGFLMVGCTLLDAAAWVWPSAPLTRAGWAAGGATAAVLWGLRSARGRARIARVRVPISDLGPAFDGFRIVQLSDMHVGQTRGGDCLERVVDEVNRLEPDLVAITGDLVDGFVDCLGPELAALARLRPKVGIFFVTGNHEYYYGGGAWEAELRRRGLQVLHNEHRVLRRGEDALAIAGVTDFDGGEYEAGHAPDPDAALRGIPPGVPRLLLAHQPRSAEALQGSRVDLQLSGHTHGGQLWPFAPLVLLQQPVIRGLKTLWGTRVYTSSGTGYWGPPVRLGAPPEISEITLESLPSARAA